MPCMSVCSVLSAGWSLQVIVQMSVEFAMQSEMNRISLQSDREIQQDKQSEEAQVRTRASSTQMRLN